MIDEWKRYRDNPYRAANGCTIVTQWWQGGVAARVTHPNGNWTLWKREWLYKGMLGDEEWRHDMRDAAMEFFSDEG